MLKKIINWFKQQFREDTSSELEKYLRSKNPKTQDEMNFWLAEFDLVQRNISKSIANGDYEQAQNLRRFFF